MNDSASVGFDPWIFDSSDPRYESKILGREDKRLFRTYVEEAVFFWRFLKPLIEERNPARALEVGAGIGLLSLFAATRVKSVTALEPESSGFGRMSNFRKAIINAWHGKTEPKFKACFLHELPNHETFDFIYCINVIEHVAEPEALIEEIYDRLEPGGMAWFVLPNYTFPYEQHFEIPIVLNKSYTQRLFHRRIRNHKASPDPEGLWAELSWPTQKKLSEFLRSSNRTHQFRATVLEGYFDRLGEPSFIGRKGPLYKALRPVIALLKPLIIKLPLSVLPIIEFSLYKPDVPLPETVSLKT